MRQDLQLTPDGIPDVTPGTGIWDLDIDTAATVADGDLVTGPSDQQHIEMILQSAPGHWREHPLLGADLEELLNGPATLTELRAKVNVQMELDGYSSESVQLDRQGEEWQLTVNLENPQDGNA